MPEETSFSSVAETVQTAVGNALREVVEAVPEFIAALLVLLIGIIVAAVLKGAVVRLLHMIKLKPYTDRVGLNRVFPGEYNLVELTGDFVKWFFIILFLLQALDIVGLDEVSDLVGRVLAYVPNVLVAAVIVFVGVVIADLASRLVASAAAALDSTLVKSLSAITRYTILAVVVFTALAQLGVNTLFLDRLFTAIVVMLAVAGGLAFGLGGRDMAKDMLDSVRENFRR